MAARAVAAVEQGANDHVEEKERYGQGDAVGHHGHGLQQEYENGFKHIAIFITLHKGNNKSLDSEEVEGRR
jgi:hypothetical protein